MNYPLKKRRGRPPKYLNVWQQQHMQSLVKLDNEKQTSNIEQQNSSNDNKLNNNSMPLIKGGPENRTSNFPAVLLTASQGELQGVDVSNIQTSCNNNDVHANDGNNNCKTEENMRPSSTGGLQVICITDNQHSPTPLDVSPASLENTGVSRTIPADPVLNGSISPKNNDSYHMFDVVRRDEPPQLSPVPYKCDQSEGTYYINNTDDVTHDMVKIPDGGVDFDAIDNGNRQTTNRNYGNESDVTSHNQNNKIPSVVHDVCIEPTNHVTELRMTSPRVVIDTEDDHVLENHNVQLSTLPQPLKRRPGRPPGSTKKIRTSYPPFIKPKTPEDQFSLRRFFEAGGRDYNEYLDWLKRKSTSTEQPHHAPVMFPPFHPMQMSGDRIIMTSQGVPRGFPFQAPFPVTIGARNPTANIASSNMYRHPGPVMAAAMSQMTSQSTIRHTAHPQLSVISRDASPPISHGDDTKPNYEQIANSCTDPSKSKTHIVDACALDLSSKRARSDSSDSEKENDYTDISKQAKRPRLERDFYPDDASVFRNGTREEKQVLEVDARLIPDQTVQSSTGCDATEWSVDQVANFVSTLPECHVYSQTFRTHRIDGATLPHLSDDHLLNHVGMKLGHMIRLQLALSKLKSEK